MVMVSRPLFDPMPLLLEGCFKNEITRVEDASPRNEELLLTYKLMIT